MTNYRRSRRRIDGNHGEIVAAFKARGYQVLSLATMGGGVPDLLVHRVGQPIRLIEVKAARGVVSTLQEKFMAEGWPVTIVRNKDDVVNL